ncbi:MAG: DUF2064 domain-containing protein [Nakamurella sp.]
MTSSAAPPPDTSTHGARPEVDIILPRLDEAGALPGTIRPGAGGPAGRPADLGVTARRSGYPLEMLLRATRAGWRLFERDITYWPEHLGKRSKVDGSPRRTVDAVTGMGRHHRPIIALAGDLAGACRGSEIDAALDARWDRIPQHGACFAARLVAAHRMTARRHPGRPVLQIAMDTPHLTSEILLEAAAQLHLPGHDAVLGPTPDGGWWLLGLRDPRAARALRGVTMSTSHTRHDTLTALRDLGLRVGLLPSMTDVDTWSEAVTVAAAAPTTRFGAAVRLCQADGSTASTASGAR